MAPPSEFPLGQQALAAADLLGFYRQLAGSLLTVVDVETSGSRPHQARVIEVAVVQASLETGIQWQTSALVQGAAAVPANITRLTGITTAMVHQGTPAVSLWPDLRPRLDQGVLTAHNLAFDYGFLQSEYRRLKDPAQPAFTRHPSAQLCTVLLSRLLLADLPSRSLPRLVEHFRLPVDTSHRAEADTVACWLVAEILLRRLQTLDDDRVLTLLRRQWLPLRTVVPQFRHPARELRQWMDKRDCERKVSKRSNRPLYRRGDLEALHAELYPPQLSLPLE